MNDKSFTSRLIFAWFGKVMVYPRTKKGLITRTESGVFFGYGEEGSPSHISVSQRNGAKPFLVRGFTLFELLVSISIMLLMTMVVIFNYNDFRDNVGLTTAIQDVSLDVREMQSNALGVHSYVQTDGQSNFDIGYGIHFSINNKKAENNYVLFRDFLAVGGYVIKKYDEGGGSEELIATQNPRTGYTIKGICFKELGNSPTTPCFSGKVGEQLGGYSSVEAIDVTFVRPSAEANIRFFSGGNWCGGSELACAVEYISIEIQSDKTGTCSAVRIYSSGQLSTGESCISK